MSARQSIFRVRRNYNQWVANQTLEDYALRFTAKSARRWSASRVANTALGAISFLALEAIGGAITIHYGFDNAVAAICAVALIDRQRKESLLAGRQASRQNRQPLRLRVKPLPVAALRSRLEAVPVVAVAAAANHEQAANVFRLPCCGRHSPPPPGGSA